MLEKHVISPVLRQDVCHVHTRRRRLTKWMCVIRFPCELCTEGIFKLLECSVGQ